ncbi:hypothetical protein A1O7_08543 [Cladophialophora yegresii CBS 114405]|uniref:Uncharacterized protein n=1 Tax=Cladophialophora yegresii CBS 114405 TaxID=1182544 RepID=W9WAM5_9EURO|nr:uncharacterized protein A1O7_08543 [Cladophialophora yegresii CBS 114405]EXJ55614.1 hypothetical protein A1O7_08543 [Cladophialophora yegresii CBS 114405]
MLSARHSVRQLRERAQTDHVRWTITHAYFANMGAFVVEFGPELQPDRTYHNETSKGTQTDRDAASTHETGYPQDSPNELTRSSGSDRDSRHRQPDIRGPNQSTTNHQDHGSGPPKDSTDNGSPGSVAVVDTSVDEDMLHLGSEGSSEANIHLPTPAHREHSTLSARGAWCSPEPLVDCFRKPLRRIPRRYGKEIWESGAIHHELARQALSALRDVNGASIRLRARQRNIIALQGKLWVLDAAQLRLARERGLIGKLPDIHEQLLEEGNRSDTLLKLITIWQVGWMAIQLLVRLYRRLATSQLEILTFAFAVCSLLTYSLFWNKPQDIQTRVSIQAARQPCAEDLLELAVVGPSTFFHYRTGYCIPNNAVHRIRGTIPGDPRSNPDSEQITTNVEKADEIDSWTRVTFIVSSAIGSVLFGSLHFIAWKFAFPSPTEQLLWRISTAVTTGLPLAGVAANAIYVFFHKRHRITFERNRQTSAYQTLYLKRLSWLLWILATPYFVARLFILVEVFRSLSYLPPAAFRTTWSASVPHVG